MRERDAALRAWAGSMGLAYHKAMFEPDPCFAHLSLFRNDKGDPGTFNNPMHGHATINRRSHYILCADHSVSTSSSSGEASTRTTSFAAIDTPYRTPKLTIVRKGRFSAVFSALGMQDIGFEDAAFTSRFRVMCNHRAFAYDLLAPLVIEHIKQWHAQSLPFTSLLLDDGAVVVTRNNRVWTEPEDFERALHFAAGFIDRWPDHLLASWERKPSFRPGSTLSEQGLQIDS